MVRNSQYIKNKLNKRRWAVQEKAILKKCVFKRDLKEEIELV